MTKSLGIGRGHGSAGAVRRRRPVKPGKPLTPAELRDLAASHAASAVAALVDIAARGGNGMSRLNTAKLILRLAAGEEELAPPADQWGNLLDARPKSADGDA